MGSRVWVGWELVGGTGEVVEVVEEDEVGQNIFCRLWELDWLLVCVILPWICAGLRTKPLG
jgi:hypothetical protein